MIGCTELLISTQIILIGSIISHSAIWYRIGRLEKMVQNGNGKK